jgi:lysophospholipase L1-like esterase
MKKILLTLFAAALIGPAANAQNTPARPVPPPIAADPTVVANTLDSLNKALTARPVPGSSRREGRPVLFLIGDSTMRTGTQGNGDNGQWGWGFFAGNHFNDNLITVENHALGGLSSRTFYDGYWAPIRDAIRPGDWVIIQLGHNDNGAYDSGRARASIPGIGTDSLIVTIEETGERRTVHTFGGYLRNFVNETRARGGRPVLMSVTIRNSFDPEGRVIRNTTQGVWSRQIAEEMNVPFVDLNEMGALRYEVFGPEKVKQMFYGDNIHTSAFGAVLNAELAAEGIRAVPGLELAAFLKDPKVPYESTKRVGDRPVLFTVGDSTVRNADSDEDGMWGWGSVIERYFDTDKITVDNQAMAGRSTRTYLDEGRWDRVYEALRPGDFVLIQFGHNDGGPINTRPARGVLQGTGEESVILRMAATGRNQAIYTFGWYLRKFIRDVQEKGATPIVLSHTPRNQWDENGRIRRADLTYGLWAKEAARQTRAAFIDLNGITAGKLERMDPETVNTYFKNDHTHESLSGALMNAESIVEGLRRSNLPLREFLIDPTPLPAIRWR